MNVENLMSRSPKTCTPDHMLDCAARSMWDGDCGVVPVVDEQRRVVGMITDRDICFAAYTQNRRLGEIPISSVALKQVVTVRQDESVEAAESLMQRHQVRRLAVVDENKRLVGVLSLTDLARSAARHPLDLSTERISQTLAAIGRPHRARATA